MVENHSPVFNDEGEAQKIIIIKQAEAEAERTRLEYFLLHRKDICPLTLKPNSAGEDMFSSP